MYSQWSNSWITFQSYHHPQIADGLLCEEMDIYNVALRCVVETLPSYTPKLCNACNYRIFPHKPSSFSSMFSFNVVKHVTINYSFHPSMCSVYKRSNISQSQQHLLCLITVRQKTKIVYHILEISGLVMLKLLQL